MRTIPPEQKGGNYDEANKVRALRSALMAAGLPSQLGGATDVPAAAATIQAERPGIRTAVRAALDLLLQNSPREGFNAEFEFAAWLDVANRCDDNPFRREARTTGVQAPMEYLIKISRPVSPLAPSRAEPPVGLPDLVRLIERAEAEDPPVDAVLMLAAAMMPLDGGADPRLRRLLEVARDRHPNDLELLDMFVTSQFSVWEADRKPRALAEALGGCRAHIALRPEDADGYYSLGYVLAALGDHAGAAAACRTAVARNPKFNFARINLAEALEKLGDLDGAIAVLRETARLDPSFARAHWNLDGKLHTKGDLDGAIAEFKEAVRLDPKQQYGVVILPKLERMRKLLPRLSDVLAGKARPKDPAESCAFAELCTEPFQKRYVQGVRLYAEAFAADPTLLDGWKAAHAYYAAVAAVRAAQGEGEDTPSDPAGRSALRPQALGWLRGFLAIRQRQAGSAKPADREAAARALNYWLADAGLAGVRDAEALAKLPAAEREAWEKFWADVKATLADASKEDSPPPTGTGKK